MHTISPMPKRKMNPEGGALANPGGLELNMTNMEIDEANNLLAWFAVQFVERKFIAEELAQEGLTIF
jgi:hypothetical protein